LQIENELYAPVRPKQVAESGEKPTDALENRGVMYVELRALDVNPFSPYGITLEQMRVLDVFLLYCLLSDENTLTSEQQSEAEANQDAVVLNGRDKALELSFNGQIRRRSDWMTDIFNDFEQLANWLDGHYGGRDYSEAIALVKPAVEDPTQTLSGQLMSKLLHEQVDNGCLGLALAEQYKSSILNATPQEFSFEYLSRKSEFSFCERRRIEAADTLSFDDFLANYFTH